MQFNLYIDNELFSGILISSLIVIIIAAILIPLILKYQFNKTKRHIKSMSFPEIKRKKRKILDDWKHK